MTQFLSCIKGCPSTTLSDRMLDSTSVDERAPCGPSSISVFPDTISQHSVTTTDTHTTAEVPDNAEPSCSEPAVTSWTSPRDDQCLWSPSHHDISDCVPATLPTPLLDPPVHQDDDFNSLLFHLVGSQGVQCPIITSTTDDLRLSSLTDPKLQRQPLSFTDDEGGPLPTKKTNSTADHTVESSSLTSRRRVIRFQRPAGYAGMGLYAPAALGLQGREEQFHSDCLASLSSWSTQEHRHNKISAVPSTTVGVHDVPQLAHSRSHDNDRSEQGFPQTPPYGQEQGSSVGSSLYEKDTSCVQNQDPLLDPLQPPRIGCPSCKFDKTKRELHVFWTENHEPRVQKFSCKKLGKETVFRRAQAFMLQLACLALRWSPDTLVSFSLPSVDSQTDGPTAPSCLKALSKFSTSGSGSRSLNFSSYPVPPPPDEIIYDYDGPYHPTLTYKRQSREWVVEWTTPTGLKRTARWSCKKLGKCEAITRAERFVNLLAAGIAEPQIRRSSKRSSLETLSRVSSWSQDPPQSPIVEASTVNPSQSSVSQEQDGFENRTIMQDMLLALLVHEATAPSSTTTATATTSQQDTPSLWTSDSTPSPATSTTLQNAAGQLSTCCSNHTTVAQQADTDAPLSVPDIPPDDSKALRFSQLPSTVSRITTATTTGIVINDSPSILDVTGIPPFQPLCEDSKSDAPPWKKPRCSELIEQRTHLLHHFPKSQDQESRPIQKAEDHQHCIHLASVQPEKTITWGSYNCNETAVPNSVSTSVNNSDSHFSMNYSSGCDSSTTNENHVEIDHQWAPSAQDTQFLSQTEQLEPLLNHVAERHKDGIQTVSWTSTPGTCKPQPSQSTPPHPRPSSFSAQPFITPQKSILLEAVPVGERHTVTYERKYDNSQLMSSIVPPTLTDTHLNGSVSETYSCQDKADKDALVLTMGNTFP